MARVKAGTTRKARHKKILSAAKGFYNRNRKCYRVAIEKVEKSLQYAYRDRRNKKRDFRSLWIARINAAARQNGMVYSQFINGIKLAGIELDRKALAQIAFDNAEGFAKLAKQAQEALDKNAA